MRVASAQFFDEAEMPVAYRAELHYSPRSRFTPLLFVPSILMAGTSWIANGIPILTNFSFLFLIAVCFILIIEELINFSKRFGLGGITLYGGVLMWFCYDYMRNWYSMDFTLGLTPFSPGVIAKAAFLHHFFICFASIGLQLPMSKWLEHKLAQIPEPSSHQLYFGLVLFAFFIGMIPNIFFKSDPFFVALWKDIVGGRSGASGFTVGRTGNLNTSWGGYLAQLQQIGEVGSILALFYVLVLKPPLIPKIVCLLIWLLQLAFAFGNGTRGETAHVLLPAMFLLFLKYQSQAAEVFRRFSVKAYIVSGAVAFALLVIIQIQITYRNQGFSEIELDKVKTNIEGNSMFSEGLPGMALIPEQRPFFYDSFPGQGIFMALPDVAWRFIYGPIPRALWTSKPVDPLWKWYNSVVTGRPEDDMEGTTISTGLIGDWYFRCGLPGLVEGGLLFGWLCLLAERMLQNSQGKLLQMIGAIGLLVFLFRAFRNFTFITLYPLLIGMVFLIIAIRIFRGARQQQL